MHGRKIGADVTDNRRGLITVELYVLAVTTNGCTLYKGEGSGVILCRYREEAMRNACHISVS